MGCNRRPNESLKSSAAIGRGQWLHRPVKTSQEICKPIIFRDAEHLTQRLAKHDYQRFSACGLIVIHRIGTPW